MTNQTADNLTYQDQLYEISGIKGGKLLTPEAFGMKPIPMSTGCYRGYVFTYLFKSDQLTLTEMLVRAKNNFYPPIKGVVSKAEDFLGGIPSLDIGYYTGLEVSCPFSGGLVIVNGLINNRSVVPMPVDYKTVIELILENGMLRQVVDHSPKIKEIRNQIKVKKKNWVSPFRDMNEHVDAIIKRKETGIEGDHLAKEDEFREEIRRYGWSFAEGYEQQPQVF